MMFFVFTFTPSDHPNEGVPSITGYVQADTPEQAKSEARRQLREELDPENCTCYQPVRLVEITREAWMHAQASGLSTEPVDKCSNSLGEYPAESGGTVQTKLDKKQSVKTLCPPEMMIPVCGSIESSADFDGQDLPGVLNQRLAAISCGESLVIHGLNCSTYHACDGYSASQALLVQAGGLAALGWYKNAPRDMQVAVTSSVSTAVRAAILEPVRFAADYATAGEGTLSDDDYRRVCLMHDSALANPILSSLLQRGVASPSVFYRTRGGVLLKVRPDWIGEMEGVAYILNIKTVDDLCDFGELVERRGYHVRTAFYNFVVGSVFGIDPVFAFCTISTRKFCGRYLTQVRSLDDEYEQEGVIQFRKIITSLESFQRGDISVGMGVVRRPPWARPSDGNRCRCTESTEAAGNDV